MLSKEALQEFKQIWFEKFGEEISDEFALEQAINLLTVISATYRPINKLWINTNDYAKHKQ